MFYSRNDRYRRTISRHDQQRAHDSGFRCIQCGQHVSCAPLIAGVQNRNHCPACLWSRHLDWREAGDRLSSCRAAMEPIGLTTKRSRNRYASGRDGELMLIHRCTACGEIVINRIAADDSADAIIEVFERSRALSDPLAAAIRADGVELLRPDDRALLDRRLFGGQHAMMADACC